MDNLGVLGLILEEVTQGLSEAVALFDQAGLETHERQIVEGGGKALGTLLDGVNLRTRLTPQRFWRVFQGLGYALQCKRLPGRVWEILLGHATFCALVRRELLSCFNCIYAFIRKKYYESQPLWSSAREEIVAFRGGMFMLFADWTLPWSSCVGASDASLDGMGVCSGQWPLDQVARHGRVMERSRFLRGPGKSARDSYFLDNGFTMDPLSGLWRPLLEDELPTETLWKIQPGFPEIEIELLQKRLWQVRVSRPWRMSDDILVLEARALFRSLQVQISLHHAHDCRVLLLVDNMAVALSFGRKRSRNFKVLVQIRTFSAFLIAFNIRCAIRWIPSEANMSDDPSRQFFRVEYSGSDFTNNMFQSLAPGQRSRPCTGVSSQVDTHGSAETSARGTERTGSLAATESLPDTEISAEAAGDDSDENVDGSLTRRPRRSALAASEGACASGASQRADPEPSTAWSHGSSRGSQGAGAAACPRPDFSPSTGDSPPGGEAPGESPQRQRGERCDYFRIGGGSPATTSGGDAASGSPLSTAASTSAVRDHGDGSDDLPGALGGEEQRAVRQGSAEVFVLASSARRAARRGQRGGRRHRKVGKRDVPERQAGQFGRDAVSGDPPSGPGVWPLRFSPVASFPPGFEGMAPTNAGSISSTARLQQVVQHGLGTLWARTLPDGRVHPLVRLSLHAALGAAGDIAWRHPEAGDQHDSAVAATPLPRGAGRSFEDLRGERQHRDPLSVGPLAAAHGGSVGRRTEGRGGVQFHVPGVSGGVGSLSEAVWPQDGALRGSTHGTQCGCCQVPSNPHRDQESRPLGQRALRDSLRAESPFSPQLQSADGDAAGPSRILRGPSRGYAPREGGGGLSTLRGDRRTDTASEQGRYFADLFCGTGGVGKRWRRRGFVARFYDIVHGTEYDLTHLPTIRRLQADARAGKLLGCMIAITCRSWSTARNWTNVLRSKAEPWGLSQPLRPWSERDLERLAEGNLQLERILPLLHTLVRCNIPFALENPAPSYMWHTPELQAIAEHKHATLAVVDQCAWRRPWRKRTRLLCFGLDSADVEHLASHRCTGKQRCSFTGRRHIQLTGTDPHGIPWTARAQEFPKGMARFLADAIAAPALLRRGLSITR